MAVLETAAFVLALCVAVIWWWWGRKVDRDYAPVVEVHDPKDEAGETVTWRDDSLSLPTGLPVEMPVGFIERMECQPKREKMGRRKRYRKTRKKGKRIEIDYI